MVFFAVDEGTVSDLAIVGLVGLGVTAGVAGGGAAAGGAVLGTGAGGGALGAGADVAGGAALEAGLVSGLYEPEMTDCRGVHTIYLCEQARPTLGGSLVSCISAVGLMD